MEFKNKSLTVLLNLSLEFILDGFTIGLNVPDCGTRERLH